MKENVLDPEVSCWIINERDFFLKTLTYFGLPDGYLEGKGHWHDWAYEMLEEKKKQAMKGRLNVRKQKKEAKRTRKQDDKKDEDIKPPDYFDLAPFKRAIEKFLAAGPEVRTLIRTIVLNNLK